MNKAVLFSSNSDEWATPQWLFDELNEEFDFTLDPCATEENHKVSNYLTKYDNSLAISWGGRESFAIRHIARLTSGLRKLLEKLEMIILWLYCSFQAELTQDIFTTISIKEQK